MPCGACFILRLTLFLSRVHKIDNKKYTEKPLKTVILNVTPLKLPKKESVNYFWAAVKYAYCGIIFWALWHISAKRFHFRDTIKIVKLMFAYSCTTLKLIQRYWE